VATDIKILMADLKRIYAAPTEEITLVESNSFEEKWAAKYHHYRVRHTPHR
jgi:transposase-like protein